MNTILVYIGAVVVTLTIFVGVSCLAALPTYWLWNWLMPDIFNLPLLTFWQALGVNLLTGVLFKSYWTKP